MRPKPLASSEDLRTSELRRGNLKRKHHQSEYSNPSDAASKKTLQDLVDEEKDAKAIDEVYLRNLNRVGSRYKGGEFGSAKGEGNGFDEEHQVDMTMFTDKDERVTDLKRWEREKQRKQAEGSRLKKVESGSWWWVSSTRFEKSSLLSLGEHTTLGMCPTHLSVGGATYIVPVQHATRFNECDAEVWGEVGRFKAGLAKMFKGRGEEVVFVETARGNMQGRIEALPLKKGTDFKLRFKASMREVLDESEVREEAAGPGRGEATIGAVVVHIQRHRFAPHAHCQFPASLLVASLLAAPHRYPICHVLTPLAIVLL